MPERTSADASPHTPLFEGTDFERLVVVSNRLPVVLAQKPDGYWSLERGSGGLVTALEPVLRANEGVWLGWPGVDETEVVDVEGVLSRESERLGYHMKSVGLSKREQDDFYLGFSNQVIWPLFHDFQGHCNFRPAFWDAYTSVNRKFAEAVAWEAGSGDFVWIHDYHLMGVAEGLRRKGIELPTGFFLHIPFPAPDLFQKLPWRFSVIRSLLHHDLIGFQTLRSRKNFLDTLRLLVPEAEIDNGDALVEVRVGDRTVRVGAFPISIDVDDFSEVAERVQPRAEELRTAFENAGEGKRRRTVMLLGVDRLDYSKGIPHKLRGFREALRRYPELRGAVTLVQLIVPSREDIPEYDRMKDEIDRLVGKISGEFMRAGWSPVHYQYGRWERPELVAHYRAARVGLVTPLKDGMNLVAKEFCASSVDDDGVLVLSEHAGATAQLQEHALRVNPYDVEQLADVIHRACTMRPSERRERMRGLRACIRREDIHWWVRVFLRSARGDREEVGTVVPDYRPPLPEDFMNGFRR